MKILHVFLIVGLVQLGIGGSVMQYRKYFNSKEFKENPKVKELQEVLNRIKSCLLFTFCLLFALILGPQEGIWPADSPSGLS